MLSSPPCSDVEGIQLDIQIVKNTLYLCGSMNDNDS